MCARTCFFGTRGSKCGSHIDRSIVRRPPRCRRPRRPTEPKSNQRTNESNRVLLLLLLPLGTGRRFPSFLGGGSHSRRPFSSSSGRSRREGMRRCRCCRCWCRSFCGCRGAPAAMTSPGTVGAGSFGGGPVRKGTSRTPSPRGFRRQRAIHTGRAGSRFSIFPPPPHHHHRVSIDRPHHRVVPVGFRFGLPSTDVRVRPDG